MMPNLGIGDIVAAQERIEGFTHRTPVLHSTLLDRWLGHRILFKAECLQKIGAFKARGACNTLAWLLENGTRPEKVVANSSGNHAQAVAWASGVHEIPATIFMPASASTVKVQATRSYGAEVVLCESRKIVDSRVEEAAAAGACWVPPYNHEQIICGQGTAALEALDETGSVDAVFAPCGGGGLLSGTLLATRGRSPKAEVIGAEPLNANDAAESRRKNAIQTLSQTPDTIADGAMTLAVGPLTFEYLQRLDDLMEIPEGEIVYWTQWLTHLLKVRIEPTAALGMAAASRWLASRPASQTVLVLLSGGNMDRETTRRVWAHDHLTEIPHLGQGES